MRDGLLFLHILGVAGWIGGGIYGTLASSTVARSGPPAAAILTAIEKRASAYFGITSALVLLSGIGLVLTSDVYGWGDTFVLIGLGAFVISGIVQSTIGKTANTRLLAAAEENSDLPGALGAWRRVSMFDALVLFVVVWAMIAKLGS